MSMHEPMSPRRAALDAVLLVALLGLALFGADRLALGWAGPPLILATTAAILWRARARGGGIAEVGLSRPRRIWLVGVGAIGAWIFVTVLASLVSTAVGAMPDTSELSFVEGSLSGLCLMLLVAWTSAAFGEEIVFRGFLMPRVARALGASRAAWLAACAAQAIVFGVAHAYQGAGGMLLTGTVGFGIGLCVLVAGRNLWVAILAHGIIDTVGLVALYLGVAA
jgi:hypothetical protein